MTDQILSGRLLGKLRSNGIVPRNKVLILTRRQPGQEWFWHILDVERVPLGIGSRFTMAEVWRAKHLKVWTDSEGNVNVDPAEEENPEADQ